MKTIIKSLSKQSAGLAAAIAGVAMITSCVDMDLSPTNQPSEGSVWSSPTMAMQAANGAYRGLQYPIQEAWNRFWQPFSSVQDRDANWTDFNHTYGRVTPSDGYISSFWGNNFEYAIKANAVIHNIANVPGIDPAVASRSIAECTFLRAWWHYEMNCLFQGIPYVDINITNPDECKLPRKTTDEVWDCIIKDLTDCINNPNLPDKYEQGSPQWGHITKGACYTLRGKVYLWKKEWAKAEADFKAVERCGYKLYTEGGNVAYKNVLKEANEDCDEMIFSVCFTPDVKYGNALHRANGVRSVFNGEGWGNFIVNPAFVDRFENADGSKFNWNDIIPGYNEMPAKARRVYFLRDNMTEAEIEMNKKAGADMSKYLPNGNEARIYQAYENRDPRLNMTVITPYHAFYGGKWGVGQDFISRFPFRDQGEPTLDMMTDTSAMFYYMMRKYVGEGTEVSNYYTYTDYNIFRFAEVLINLAEALNEQGKTDEAASVINRVRTRCGAALLNSNEATKVKGQADMRERIQNEFYFELGGEHNLYMEEVRWNIWRKNKFYKDAEGNMNGMRQVWGTPTYQYIDGGEHYNTWPIPQREVDNNPNMVQSPQWK